MVVSAPVAAPKVEKAPVAPIPSAASGAIAPPVDDTPLWHRDAASMLDMDPRTARPGFLGTDDAGAAVAGGGFKFFDETNATDAIVQAVDGAKQVVNAEFFGFSDAGKGAKLVDALEGAAKRGVEVNVVTDFISAGALPVGSYQRMRRRIEGAGGNVILTSRIPGSPKARQTPALKHVDHRKVVTVDGTTGFVGGMNLVKLTDEYKDTMVGLTGVDAARLAADQLDRWTRVGGPRTERHERTVDQALDGKPLTPTSPDELHIVTNAPEQGRAEITEAYRDLIRGAKERLWIASPGISDRDIMNDIADAARRGVDVKIISSQKAAVAPPIGWVARAHLENLHAAGGRGYEAPGTIHRKAMIADDQAVLSSYNLTKRSADHDHEVGIRTSNADFVGKVEQQLQADLDSAIEFDPNAFTGIAAGIGRKFAKHVSY